MALPITVPYTFGNATTAIPLSNLDSDYATVYQAVNGIGNGSVALANVAITGGTISGNTTASNVTVSSGTFTNVTLSNVTISSVSTPITAAEGGTGSSSAFTTNGVVYASSTSALATGSGLTFNGTTFSTTNDASIHGLTVGQGGGSVSTNTAVGFNAGAANSTGNSNTYLGYGVSAAGAGNTGSGNLAAGFNALNINTSGTTNVALGGGINAIAASALEANTSGSYNVAVGAAALKSNNSASSNTAVGYQAGYSNTIAGSGVCIGAGAGYTNVGGGGNTFVGASAGNLFTAASGATYNAFFGAGSGSAITSGQKNSIIGGYSGNQGGLDIRTASNYIVLSDGDGNPRQFIDNAAAAYFDTGGATNVTAGGNMLIGPNTAAAARIETGHPTGTSSGGKYAVYKYAGTEIGSVSQNGTTGVLFNLTSDYRLKNNQQALTGAKDFVMALQPKKWQWWDGSGEGVGFIAHEFMEVAKYSGHGEKDAVDAEGKPIMQTIQPSSSEVMANLVALVQELTNEIQSLKAKLGA